MKSEMIKEEMQKKEVELVKPNLLVVDDDEDLRTQMKWAFMQDYDVLLAEDRKTALEHYRKERPAVVTLDLGLPPEPAGVEEGGLRQLEISKRVIRPRNEITIPFWGPTTYLT